MNTSSSFPMSLLITLLALAAVLVLAWFAIRALSRFGGNRPGQGRIRILQSVAVGSRERLVLVRFDNVDYLLGVTAGGISTIDTPSVSKNGGTSADTGKGADAGAGAGAGAGAALSALNEAGDR